MIEIKETGKSDLDIRKAEECVLRKDNTCGYTATCQACPYANCIKEIWKDFCKVPVDYDHGYITQVWNNFPIGTPRADIVEWFFCFYGINIDWLKEVTGADFNPKA